MAAEIIFIEGLLLYIKMSRTQIDGVSDEEVRTVA
jgi:hypothetical protein